MIIVNMVLTRLDPWTGPLFEGILDEPEENFHLAHIIVFLPHPCETHDEERTCFTHRLVVSMSYFLALRILLTQQYGI